MEEVPESMDPYVSLVHTGHYRETRGYFTSRRQGSKSWLFILTLDGAGRFRHREGEVVCHSGEAALLQPRTMHEYGVDPHADGWELIWAHFHPREHWAPFLAWPRIGPGIATVALTRSFEDVFDAMRRAHREREELLAMPAIEEALVRSWREAAPTPSLVHDERVRLVTEYLQDHLAEAHSVAALSHRVGLSESRLSHLFQSELGVSPRVYLERLRMDRARRLLANTNLTIREIAEEVGMENEFYFSNRFRKLVGISPSGWRAGRP